MSRTFLSLLAGPGSFQDLDELWTPIKDHFNGICAVYFGSRDDIEAKYLETVKGAGYITYLPYTGRHDLARICAIHCGAIEDGDTVCQFDTLERLSPSFAATIPELMGNMDQVDAFFYYGKILLYRYHESVTFQGTPHEAWRLQGKQHPVCLELSKAYPNEPDVRLNVRPQKRDRWHFVKHYGRYALLPWGANHYMLGLDGKPNAQALFIERETARLAFIALLRELGIKRDVDAVIEYMRGKMDPRFVAHMSKDKVWNDVYRRYILGREDFTDDHDWSNVVPVTIPLDTPPQVG